MRSKEWFSPPVSPKTGAPARPRDRSLGLFRRHRGRLIFAFCILSFLYYLGKRRGSFIHPKHAPSLRYKSVEWRYFAYSSFATDSAYLCNSVMLFEALDRLGSKADRILLYPGHWDLDISDSKDRDSQLLVRARDWYHVKLIPVQVDQGFRAEGEREVSGSWDTSFTKFLTFNQTQYLRIIHIDSDVVILKHMDDLFLAPSARVAMTRAYWQLPETKALTSLFLLLEPSMVETERLQSLAQSIERQQNEFDMEILNKLYGNSASVLPHRKYGLLSGEFRSKNHANYFGNDYEVWDPDRAIREASLVHFSDWPLPKPWIMWPRNQLAEMLPLCEKHSGTSSESGCRSREIWLELYNDFRKRRKEICGLLSAPAPEWPPRSAKNATTFGSMGKKAAEDG